MNDHPNAARPWFAELRTYAKEEIVSHFPYTLSGALVGLALVFIAPLFVAGNFTEEEFHIAHFIHIFFSAAAGSAIFRSYQGSWIKAIPVVTVSSVGLCSLSDVLIPFAGMWLFGTQTGIHLCLMEHPFIVGLCAFAGLGFGAIGIRFFRHCNRGFHLAHIGISTLASSLYMMTFVGVFTPSDILAVLTTLFFALAVPCLVGDVVLPLCFVEIRDPFLHEKVHHSHT